ncbi:CysG1 [Acrasis kona]|uniref:CysG1 n=1 Tax=Acrasis kona TaxID=1008807 RepID=A0AAW2YMJ1_9EUKA
MNPYGYPSPYGVPQVRMGCPAVPHVCPYNCYPGYAVGLNPMGAPIGVPLMGPPPIGAPPVTMGPGGQIFTDFNRDGIPDQLQGAPPMTMGPGGQIFTDYNRDGIPDQLQPGVMGPQYGGPYPPY